MQTGVKVIDIMTEKVVVVKPTETLERCAKLMLKRHLGNVLVMKNEKLLGIITEKDLVREVISKGINAKKTQADQVMSKRIQSISPSADILEAMHHMKTHKIRRLPVIFKKNVIGIITEKDILKIQPAILEIVSKKEALVKPKKSRYIEGECDNCDSFAQLKETNGQFLCEECIDEEN